MRTLCYHAVTKGGDAIEIGDRIKEVRVFTGLSQTAFASALGVSRSAVSKLESGENIPAERTILLIVREFGVDENWLRTGEGEMLRPVSRDTELAAFFGNLQSSTPDFRHQLISVLSRLTVDEWAMLERKAKELLAEIQKDSP